MACPVCGELFLQFWDDTEEEWFCADAVFCEARNMIFHVQCYPLDTDECNEEDESLTGENLLQIELSSEEKRHFGGSADLVTFYRRAFCTNGTNKSSDLELSNNYSGWDLPVGHNDVVRTNSAGETPTRKRNMATDDANMDTKPAVLAYDADLSKKRMKFSVEQ